MNMDVPVDVLAEDGSMIGVLGMNQDVVRTLRATQTPYRKASP